MAEQQLKQNMNQDKKSKEEWAYQSLMNHVKSTRFLGANYKNAGGIQLDAGAYIEIASRINAYISYLTDGLIEAEVSYNRLIANYEAQGDSNAKAKAKAKTSDSYVKFRRYEIAIKLGYEAVRLAKKYATIKTEEYKIEPN